MKRALKRFLIFVAVLGVLTAAAWYFLMYNPDLTAGMLRSWGNSAMEDGNYSRAVTWYRWACRLSDPEQETAVLLAEAYRAGGNYTKAEFTLANAIAAGGGSQVYLELSRVYVEQDKLLDAVTMLDQISDLAVKAELDAQRPAAPEVSLAPGYYNQYMDVEVTAATGSLYVSVDGEYPSLKGAYEGPFSLGLGETTVQAVAVGENGLVSPLSAYGYTISGVVERVQLQDSALDALVRELLSRSAGSDLTTADLWSIAELTVPAETLELTDLAYFTGLTSLTIQEHAAPDLSFLSSLTKLETLDLSDSTISPESLSLIGSLPNLKSLNLARCGLSTLSGLETLTTLTELNLSENSISDVTPLGGNAGLQTLNLQRNAISNVTGLSGMTALAWLDVSYNSLGDMSPLSGCASLTWLDVSNNNLTALSGIGRLTGLTYLDGSYNALTDVTGIGSCTALTELDLSNNVLDNMDELVTLVNVSVLDVSYNDILTIPDFPDVAALATFNGCHNFFEDVSGLAGLQSLNYVYLDYNNISDINVLSTCNNLVQVNVFRTNVSDISALQGMDVIISYNPT